MRRPRNNTELWAGLDEIASHLRSAHAHDWAMRLETARSFSAMPGEILGETRLVLRELVAARELDPSVQRLAEGCIEYLDTQLNGRVRAALRRIRQGAVRRVPLKPCQRARRGRAGQPVPLRSKRADALSGKIDMGARQFGPDIEKDLQMQAFRKTADGIRPTTFCMASSSA
jgi:hypothetical protein